MGKSRRTGSHQGSVEKPSRSVASSTTPSCARKTGIEAAATVRPSTVASCPRTASSARARTDSAASARSSWRAWRCDASIATVAAPAPAARTAAMVTPARRLREKDIAEKGFRPGAPAGQAADRAPPRACNSRVPAASFGWRYAMAFSQEDIRHNGEHFAAKLKAERQVADVVHWVNKDSGAPDLVLLDTRARDAFAKAHIQGAVSAPLAELPQLAGQLPRDKELVTYCWSRT
ncbi:MAG: hypothetical protein E6J78_20195 [Deltaproteobacteria bacterium]|nr:MAG: hypothetical protein E6J78_20195 [Deltaproteobacteria bacterium]